MQRVDRMQVHVAFHLSQPCTNQCSVIALLWLDTDAPCNHASSTLLTDWQIRRTSELCHTFLAVPAEISCWSHCHYKWEKLLLQCSQSNLACTSSSNSTTVLCVHHLLCTVGGQQLDVRLLVSQGASRKKDGISFCVVDYEVYDSTSVIKLQSMDRSLPFAAMNACLDASQQSCNALSMLLACPARFRECSERFCDRF